MNLILILLSSLYLTGCANTIPVELDPKVFYKNDAIITVDGQTFNGVGVVKKNLQYKIQIESKEDVDLLTITSCHRQLAIEGAIKQGWTKVRRQYEFVYNPDDIEQMDSCALRFGAYAKNTGQHSWGFLDFTSDEATLSAQYSCDGYFYPQDSVGVCQSHQGLIQEIQFPVPVKLAMMALPEKCRIPVPADNKNWIFALPNRECTYAFMEIAEPHRIHRTTTIGYEQIPIRGAQ